MLKTSGLNHVAVRASDVEKSKEFYETVIGLKKIPRPNINIPGEWYGFGGETALHVIGAKPREGIDPTGPHMAIEVEDFEATKAELVKRGIPFLDGAPMMAQMKMSPEELRMLGQQLWVKDPDGNVIELRKGGR
jgi:catechol 2,3-dioxygenase-like lactoylglutathione lyase family enzyme